MSEKTINVIHLSEKNSTSPYWDRGFLYGESVYDVIAFYDKKPLYVEEHYQRFHRDLSLMKITLPLSLTTFHNHLMHAINGTCYNDGAVYIQVSSGNYGIRTAMPPHDEIPTVVFIPFEHKRPTLASLTSGIKIVLYPESRGAYCHVKSTNRLPTRLALLHAKELGASEALWFNTESGHIHEGTSSNIFFIQDNQLITPDLSPFVFQGLARENILRIADTLGITCIRRKVHINELSFFQGCFITGSIKQLVPVRQLEQHYYSIHPLWATIFKAYNRDIDNTLSYTIPCAESEHLYNEVD